MTSFSNLTVKFVSYCKITFIYVPTHVNRFIERERQEITKGKTCQAHLIVQVLCLALDYFGVISVVSVLF